ncbi:MAG TPA: diguanylate cyclase [Myxococcales bacterium]|nr:diguanylate cyclase [Myxococcales bacterium]
MPSYALIAEPDPGQAQVYRHLALAEGFEAKVVRDGEEAMALIKIAGPPALTITELALPRIDGFRLIEEIRKLAPAATAPVVAISAFRALREAAVRLRADLGISALLARSAPVDSILRAVKKVLAASQAPHGPAPAATSAPPPATVHEIDEERAEEVRLHRLDQMQILGAAGPGDEQDPELRAMVEAAAKRFNVPAAMISLVAEDRQWAMAHTGLTGALARDRGAPREWSFCTHVVQGRQAMVIPDASQNAAFAQNPLVVAGELKGYAGAPLETASGDVLGTLCLIDQQPIQMTADDLDALVVQARQVVGQLELRVATRRIEREKKRMPQEAQEHLEASAAPYLSAVLDNIDNGVFLLDQDRKVVFANQALADLFAVAPDSLVGRTRDELLHEAAQLSSDPDEFLRRLRTPEAGPFALRGEFEMERPRRRYVRWTAKPVQLPDGIGHLMVLTDVTAERELQREREQLARTDPITGLMNRRAAEEVLEREASRAQRFGSRISVALVDLDHFKQINDRHGHAAGDEALRAVAQVITSAMRGVDAAARWGGDELLGILPATGLEGARSFGERVRAAVERLPEPLMHGVTLSIGVAELQPGEDWADAVRRADAKLYEAKDAGRNRVA